MKYEVKPQKVCPSKLTFDLEGDIVTNIEFTDGCKGNLKAISKLLNGMSVSEIEAYLKGNTCGGNDTSCGDQLAKAVREKYEASL
ncbi:MAG: TIGR03905 family TSCPD domain-containing protein [Lachnospiraceae bacterium]